MAKADRLLVRLGMQKHRAWPRILRACCVGILLSCCFIAQIRCEIVAEDWIAGHWGVSEGLPIASVTAMIQGRSGYLWLTTYDGLVRFDGLTFKAYRSADFPELPSDRLTSIHQDSEGNIWVTTEQHHLVRLRDGEFTHFNSGNGLPHDHVFSWSEGPDKSMWFGTRGGLSRYRNGTMEPFAPERIDEGILAIAEEPDGTLWIGTQDAGVLRVQGSHIEAFGMDDGLPSEMVQALLITQDGTVWAGTNRGLTRWSGNKFEEPLAINQEFKGAHVLSMEEGVDGTLYVATGNGLLAMGPDGPSTLSHSTGYTGIEPLFTSGRYGVLLNSGNELVLDGKPLFRHAWSIRSHLVDREFNLWIATPDDGLYRLRPASVSMIGEAEGLLSENLYPIAEGPDGDIWLGSADGSVARVSSSGIETIIEPNSGIIGPVLSILPDDRGGAWIGGSGLTRYDDGVFHRNNVPPDLTDVEIRALYRDSEARIWVGTQLGELHQLDGMRWRRWSVEDGLPTAPLRVFAEGHDGSLWIGTNGGGLVRFLHGEFETFSEDNGFPSNLIRAILVDTDGLLWVGTENRGLVRLDARAGPLAHAQLTHYRQSSGLFSDGLHQVLDDGLGSLWMSTNQGIFSVTLADLNAFAAGNIPEVTSLSFAEDDGMRNREANGGVHSAGIVASDGRIWFPTQAGAAIIKPGIRELGTEPPPISLETLVIRGRGTVRTQDITQAGTPFKLSPDERNFEVHYTSMTFINPERVRFRYRLSGLNEQWTDAGTRRQAIFTNVPPGTYFFEVEAMNRSGIWNRHTPAMQLILAPRFVETPWFTAIAVIGILAIAAGLGLWRFRLTRRYQKGLEQTVRIRTEELAREKRRVEEALIKVEEQATRLRDLDQAKNRFFANVSHELRTPLTLILAPLLDVGNGQPEDVVAQVPVMRRNALRLRRMIGQILDLQKADSGTLKLVTAPTDLASLLNRTADAFQWMAERREIRLTVTTPDSDCIAQADEEQVEKIIANLLSNALKYTDPGGSIELSLESVAAEGGTMNARICVRDSGIGIPDEAMPHLFERFYQVDSTSTRAREGMGIGLALSRELAVQHGGSLTATSAPGRGATFILTIPVSSETLETVKPPGPNRIWKVDPKPVGERTATLSSTPVDDENTSSATSRRRVLIVEDNEDLRNYLRRTLAAHYDVLTAEDGEAGLEMAGRELPDVVLADVMMPRMDGYALGRALQADPQTGGIPLLFVTARASESDVMEGFSAGAVAYITKPFNASMLLARVEALLRQQERLRARLQTNIESSGADESQTCGPYESRLRAIIQSNLHDDSFGVEQLAQAAATSRPTMFRRLKEESGLSPSVLLSEMRLECAESLLIAGEGTVSEVAYAVGFVSLAGFSRAYKRRYGVSPVSRVRKQAPWIRLNDPDNKVID